METDTGTSKINSAKLKAFEDQCKKGNGNTMQPFRQILFTTFGDSNTNLTISERIEEHGQNKEHGHSLSINDDEYNEQLKRYTTNFADSTLVKRTMQTCPAISVCSSVNNIFLESINPKTRKMEREKLNSSTDNAVHNFKDFKKNQAATHTMYDNDIAATFANTDILIGFLQLLDHKQLTACFTSTDTQTGKVKMFSKAYAPFAYSFFKFLFAMAINMNMILNDSKEQSSSENGTKRDFQYANERLGKRIYERKIDQIAEMYDEQNEALILAIFETFFGKKNLEKSAKSRKGGNDSNSDGLYFSEFFKIMNDFENRFPIEHEHFRSIHLQVQGDLPA